MSHSSGTASGTPQSGNAPPVAGETAAAQEGADGAIVSPTQVRYLKIAIAVMTAMLAIGIPVLIGRVIYLAQRGNAQAPAAAVTGEGGGADTAVLMAKARLQLPAGAVVRGLSLSGRRLAVQFVDAAGADGVAILDLATGAVVSRIEITR